MFRTVAVVCLVWGMAGAATAATLRFDTVSGAPIAASGAAGASVALTGATLVAAPGSQLFLYRAGDFGFPAGGGFCALGQGFFCKGQATLIFAQPVTSLTLDAFFVGNGDRAVVSAFAGDELLRAVDVLGNGLIDFRGLQGVTRISFIDQSASFGTGIAYGNLRYTLQPPPPPPPPEPVLAPVPLPATGVMLLAALGLMAGQVFRSRRNRVRTASLRERT